MNTLGNIVRDLSEKRLLPVAIALLLIMVAAPTLALKRGQEKQLLNTPVSLAQQNRQSSEQEKGETAAEGGAGQSQTESQQQAKDPFAQQGGGVTDDGSAAEASEGVEPVESGGDGSGGGSLDTARVDLGAESSADPVSDVSAGGEVSTGGDSTSDTQAGSNADQQAEQKFYRQVITLHFGVVGKLRLKKNISPVYPLPSSSNPVATFIGFSAYSRTAIFLVNQAVTQKGEGVCKPTPARCYLLYLREDPDQNEHTFTKSNGRMYRIVLKSIDLAQLDERPKVTVKKDDLDGLRMGPEDSDSPGGRDDSDSDGSSDGGGSQPGSGDSGQTTPPDQGSSNPDQGGGTDPGGGSDRGSTRTGTGRS